MSLPESTAVSERRALSDHWFRSQWPDAQTSGRCQWNNVLGAPADPMGNLATTPYAPAGAGRLGMGSGSRLRRSKRYLFRRYTFLPGGIVTHDNSVILLSGDQI
jgi:hypothetical protein